MDPSRSASFSPVAPLQGVSEMLREREIPPLELLRSWVVTCLEMACVRPRRGVCVLGSITDGAEESALGSVGLSPVSTVNGMAWAFTFLSLSCGARPL